MKSYESVPRSRLVSQIPVMARLDGKAFHTFTRGFDRPYARTFHECMWETAKYLCEHVQGVRIAYVQSDEITLLLTQKTVYMQPWFDYEVQKMCSVAASWAGVAFLSALQSRVPQHATRNSIQMLGQAFFSYRELHNKSCDDIQEMLFSQKGLNWSDCPVPQKRGVCLKKESYVGNEDAMRTRWVVDENIPVFTQDRDYITSQIPRPEEDEHVGRIEGQEGQCQAVDPGA